MGRPSKYQESFALDVEKHCLLGATDDSLAEHLGISVSTLNDWKNKFPEFSEAIKRGKAPADAEVAHKLFERAKGAEWTEEQAIKLKRVHYGDGKRLMEEEYVEVVEVTRRAPPDTTAAIFWLKNRKPEAWRDKTEVAVTDDRDVAELAAQIRAERSGKGSS